MRSRRSRSLRFAAALALALAGAALPAYAATYWTTSAVLKSFFGTSKRITYKRFSLPDAEAAAIAKKIGASQVKKDWVVYFGESDGKRDEGFAIKDAEIGMHEPIDYAVRFTDKGAVDRVEIMEYREPYGDEVRAERFRKQFVGKTPSDAITAGQDIDIISGASYSSKSLARGVKRDALVLQAALKSGSL